VDRPVGEGLRQRVVNEPVLLDEREPVEARARDDDLEVVAGTVRSKTENSIAWGKASRSKVSRRSIRLRVPEARTTQVRDTAEWRPTAESAVGPTSIVPAQVAEP
jgi:hypothetical protein